MSDLITRTLYKTLYQRARILDQNPALKVLLSGYHFSHLEDEQEPNYFLAEFLDQYLCGDPKSPGMGQYGRYYWPDKLEQDSVTMQVQRAFRDPNSSIPEHKKTMVGFAALAYINAVIAKGKDYGIKVNKGSISERGQSSSGVGPNPQGKTKKPNNNKGKTKANVKIVSSIEQGNVLIAHPLLNCDFQRSVILMEQQKQQRSKNGAIKGVIINQTIDFHDQLCNEQFGSSSSSAASGSSSDNSPSSSNSDFEVNSFSGTLKEIAQGVFEVTTSHDGDPNRSTNKPQYFDESQMQLSMQSAYQDYVQQIKHNLKNQLDIDKLDSKNSNINDAKFKQVKKQQSTVESEQLGQEQSNRSDMENSTLAQGQQSVARHSNKDSAHTKAESQINTQESGTDQQCGKSNQTNGSSYRYALTTLQNKPGWFQQMQSALRLIKRLYCAKLQGNTSKTLNQSSKGGMLNSLAGLKREGSVRAWLRWLVNANQQAVHITPRSSMGHFTHVVNVGLQNPQHGRRLFSPQTQTLTWLSTSASSSGQGEGGGASHGSHQTQSQPKERRSKGRNKRKAVPLVVCQTNEQHNDKQHQQQCDKKSDTSSEESSGTSSKPSKRSRGSQVNRMSVEQALETIDKLEWGYGGPVYAITFLTSDQNIARQLRIKPFQSPAVYALSDKHFPRVVQNIALGRLSLNNVRAFHGIAVWDKQQLQEELDINVWLTLKVDMRYLDLFRQRSSLEGSTKDQRDLWSDLMNELGGPYSQLPAIPIVAADDLMVE